MRYLQRALPLIVWGMESNNEFRLDASALNELSGQVVDAAITVHKEMGPGLLESVYQLCLVKELKSRNILTQTSVAVALYYKGEELDKEYVIDILVENEIVLELKAIDAILPVHEAQTISYMKLADRRLGLLINFNVQYLKQGIRRFVNKL
jgi:GxxExxY protein